MKKMIYLYKWPNLKFVWALGLLVFTLASCQKDLDNTIPNDAPTIIDYQNAIRKVLVARSTNDTVWLTQPLGGVPPFYVSFAFRQDGTAGIYHLSHNKPTIKGQLQENLIIYAGDPDAVEILEYLLATFASFNDDDQLRQILNNPANAYFKDLVELFFPVNAPLPSILKTIFVEDKNTYKVDGIYNASLTFLNKSILSDLKKARKFDFDFKVNSYSQDTIKMEGYYSTNANKQVTLKPTSLNDVKLYAKATDVILTTLSVQTEIRVAGKAIATNGLTFLRNKTAQGYDSGNGLLVFNLIKAQVTEPEFAGLTTLKATAVTFIPGGPNPPSGTVLAKFTAYNSAEKGSITRGIAVELVVK